MPTKPRSHRKIIIATIIIAVIVAIAFNSYFFDTSHEQLAPKCPFLLLTGYRCPGCGTQRALHALMHLHIAEAFRYNPFLFFALPYALFLAWLQSWGGSRKHPRLDRLVNGSKGIMTVFFLIVAYWILRNVFDF